MIRDVILKDRRQYFIDKVKAPLMKAIVLLAGRYPEPTVDNTDHPNDRAWLRIWDRFLAMENNPGREPLFKAMRKVIVCESHHDYYYRDRMNVILELWLDEVLAGNWKPRPADHPDICWKVDPNKRGAGFKFLQDHYKHNTPGDWAIEVTKKE